MPPAPKWFETVTAVEPESKFVEVQGARIHYLQWGSRTKPGLLLVHGNAAHAYWWSFIAPYLARDYNVAAMDLSGMGDSDWRANYTMETFVDEQLAVCEDSGMFEVGEPPIIVAHSFGGFVTILTGALFGNRLAGTVIVEFAREPARPAGRTAAARSEAASRLPHDGGGTRAFSAHAATDLRQCIPRRLGRPALAEAGRGRLHVEVRSRHLAELFDRRHRFAAASTKCRIAIFRGENSILLPPEIGEYMFNLLGRAAPVVEIPQAQHHVLLDQPLALVAALRALLADWEHSVPRPRPL